MAEASQCQGWRRYGGAFTFGPVKWEQCKDMPTVMLKVKQGGKTEEMLACPACWQESIANQLEIVGATPINLSTSEV